MAEEIRFVFLLLAHLFGGSANANKANEMRFVVFHRNLPQFPQRGANIFSGLGWLADVLLFFLLFNYAIKTGRKTRAPAPPKQISAAVQQNEIPDGISINPAEKPRRGKSWRLALIKFRPLPSKDLESI